MPPPRCRLDHLVVVSPDLDRGADWLECQLGVALSPGGQHPRMGTHNRLLRLQDALYLEVIAPDPSLPAPGRPRWFGLDDLSAEAAPRLAAWVARTDDLDAAGVAFQAVGADPGPVQAMSRGPWSWRITVADSGHTAFDDLAPALIEWPAGRHPTSALPPSGVRLTRLTLHHPRPAPLRALLERLGLQDAVDVAAIGPGGTARMDAAFETPRGPCRLDLPNGRPLRAHP